MGIPITGKASSRRAALVLAAALGALALAASNALAVSEDEMYALWEGAAERFEDERTVLPADSEESLWVQRVGGRIVASWPDRRWVTHSFVVVDDRSPGAWSFPISPVHHRVYLTTGLLALIRERGGARCDDQLAGVLGHEIAHLMRDHHLLRHRRAEMLGLEIPQDLAEWPAQVLGKWQKEDEFEADRYGAFYALHAGYGFDGIIRFLAYYLRRCGDDQMLDASQDFAGREHPSLSARIAELRAERRKIEEARRLFECGLDLARVRASDTARACFAQVRNTFMLSPSVAHNLACAELAQYEDRMPEGPPLEQCVSTPYATELTMKSPAPVPSRVLLAEAKADFLKACDLDRTGGFAAPRLGLSCVYLYEGDDAKAEACLQELQVGLDEPEYLNLAGVIAERAGEPVVARRAYSNALGLTSGEGAHDPVARLEQNPHLYLPALYNLAHLAESQGRPARAAQLYRAYLAFEGSRSRFGARAREGLLRCGGELPPPAGTAVVDSYRGIHVRSSGALVVEAALGEPETEEALPISGGRLIVYGYPSKGTAVVVAPGPAGHHVVMYVALSEPNRDPVAGVKIGDPAAALEERLGKPRSLVAEPGEGSWWDYASRGLSFDVEEGSVRRCLIGGWR